jgi:hypothetical protein
MNTPEQLSILKRVHQDLERELELLRRRPRMTPTEERRSRVIRKQKLRMKDLIGRLGPAERAAENGDR